MIANDPASAGGGEPADPLTRISAQLDRLSGQLRNIDDEEIPGIRRESTRIVRAFKVFAVVVAVAFGVLIYAVAVSGDSANCIIGNRTRAHDLKIEEQFVPAALHSTPAERALAARLLAEFRVKDRQQRC